MTRPPPGASFAQFFPNAPKVKAEAQSRADRERTRRKGDILGSPSTATAPSYGDLNMASSRPVNGAATTHHHTGDDSPVGELSSAVGSASSHASSSSSVFSTAARLITSSASRFPPSSTAAAPASLMVPTAAPQKTHTTETAHHNPPQNPSHMSHPTTSTTSNLAIAERTPARNPAPSVKGLKCTYDPLLDRLRNKGVSKSGRKRFFFISC